MNAKLGWILAICLALAAVAAYVVMQGK